MNFAALVSALETITPGRVFPEVVPQEVLLSTNRTPMIRYSLVSLSPDNTIDGISEDHSDETRLQFDIYATTFALTASLFEQLRDVLQTFTDPPATLETAVSFYEEDVKLYRRIVDATFHSSTV